MPLNDTCLNIGANAMRSALAYLSLHVAIPNGAGNAETTAPRQPSAWAAPINGDLPSASVNFTGGALNGPVKAVGFWSATGGGTFYGYYPLDGDQVFNGSGGYTVGAFTLVGSSG
jgi:hypothetical protein